jgi:threonine/homoserine/homoserine lactone efflux protein
MDFFGITDFRVFLTAGILLNLTPGTDSMYILGRSMAHGTRAGVVSVPGISTGSLVHTLAAASGLSLVPASSAAAFALVKYCGALYLVYLGIRMLAGSRTAGQCSHAPSTDGLRYGRIYLSGIMTNVLNPKVAVFFLAFLPQFIAPGTARPMFSFLLLGCTFVVTGTVWCLVPAVCSAKISGLLHGGRTANLVQGLSGLLFIGLGARLALFER